MRGNERILVHLQDCLRTVLTAVNQYFLHAEMMENWGYKKLSTDTRKESIDEMKHAGAILERMLYLDGSPNMTELFPLKIGQNVKAQLQNDLALELEAVPRLNGAIKTAVEVGDNGSRDLFQRILIDEEHHVDWLEAQLHIMSEVGVENYLAQQMYE